MSYILDALKKSEQQRGHGDVPDVQTIHSSSLNYRNEKNSYWPYILVTAVSLNLVAIVYFIIDKEKIIKDDTVELVTKNNTDTKEVSEQIKITTDEINNKKIEPEKTELQVDITANNTNNKTVLPDTVTTEPKKNSPIIERKHLKEVQKNIVEFYDLDNLTQQQIPTITISAHIYSSNPQQRSIVINNKFLEEGDYVIDELILQEITTDGAIFDFEGTLFHYGVVSGWQ